MAEKSRKDKEFRAYQLVYVARNPRVAEIVLCSLRCLRRARLVKPAQVVGAVKARTYFSSMGNALPRPSSGKRKQ
ncbi:MAG: hypothetical protein HYW56_00950 [Candidatus Harrisonbacteria bacterium]|nr:hypothetical protein [Candidatus Harrisonbacteria bacterium]